MVICGSGPYLLQELFALANDVWFSRSRSFRSLCPFRPSTSYTLFTDASLRSNVHSSCSHHCRNYLMVSLLYTRCWYHASLVKKDRHTKLLPQVMCVQPVQSGRILIGMVAGFTLERWPTSDWNTRPDNVRICRHLTKRFLKALMAVHFVIS